METNVIYKYRAPGSLPENDRTITTETMNLDPNELLPDAKPPRCRPTIPKSSANIRESTRFSIADP